jgi:hypoxanthine-DNA glycosylase
MSSCSGFPPVAKPDARVLILGTLPGEESLKRQQYYARTTNSFWRIMAELTGANPTFPYAKKLASLTAKRLALWDVCAAAERSGSLDSSIVPLTIKTNDFASFFREHRHLELICFNGQHAARLFTKRVLDDLPLTVRKLPHVTLPSTSPAHATLRFEQKLQRWRDALGDFLI